MGEFLFIMRECNLLEVRDVLTSLSFTSFSECEPILRLLRFTFLEFLLPKVIGRVFVDKKHW